MKLDTDYEGWAHVREGKCYCLEDKWNNDMFYCRYIVYDKKENTVKIYCDITKTKFKMYFCDKLNYYDEECVFSSNPKTYSHDLIKIISLEEKNCDINDINRLKIKEKINDSLYLKYNVDDLKA